ncbi:hypothetical protein LguiB_001259 [Lonicera macranthoides]
MEIDHFSHEHRLILEEEEHKHVINGDGDIQRFRCCNGCLDPIPSSFDGGYYRCVNNKSSKIEPFMSIFLPRRASKVTIEEVEDSDSSDVIHFPVVDQSVTLISYILKGTNIVTEDETANQVLNHFSHEHPLIPEVQDCDCSESSSKRKLCLMNDTRVDETICNACVKPIFATPFYRCAEQCNFFLHKCCAELPTKIDQHPSHPEHLLILLPKSPTFFNLFECGGCHLYCNGFSYTCSRCKFYLDVQCGSLPNTIKHEGHHPNHVLSLRSKICNGCDACSRTSYRPMLAYGCDSCDFLLESRCALLLSQKVRHRYDEHPFILTYYPVKYHSDEYYCDLCEKPLNPKIWFYHCGYCDRSIHFGCLRPFYRWANIKYGRTLEIESHQHPLALAPVIHPDTKLNNSFRAITNYSRCDNCSKFLYNSIYVRNAYLFGFRCVECDFTLCYECAESCNYEHGDELK